MRFSYNIIVNRVFSLIIDSEWVTNDGAAAEPRIMEPQVGKPQTAKHQTAEPQIAELKMAGSNMA